MRDVRLLRINRGREPVGGLVLSDEEVHRFESAMGVALPSAYRALLATANGGHPEVACFVAEDEGVVYEFEVGEFLCWGLEDGGVQRETAIWRKASGREDLFVFARTQGGDAFVIVCEEDETLLRRRRVGHTLRNRLRSLPARGLSMRSQRMRSALTLGLLVLALGCFRSRGTPDDASVSSDAGIDARTMPDAGDWPCGLWGDYYRCSCPGIRLDCRTLGLVCSGSTGVCVESNRDERGENSCDLRTERPLTRHYCFNGDFCANSFNDAAGGGCVDVSYCRAMIELGLPHECFYDDSTPFVNGPPYPTECPEPAVPLLPHCGGPCGPCPYVMGNFATASQQQQSCIGLNEERGYGLCAINGVETCARPELGGRPLYLEAFMTVYGVQLACMVLLDDEAEDGLADNGAWVPLDNCRDYVARFPGSYACVDTEWQRVE